MSNCAMTGLASSCSTARIGPMPSPCGPSACWPDADLDSGEKDRVRVVYAGMRDAVSCVLAIREIPQPVVAAVRGSAVGCLG